MNKKILTCLLTGLLFLLGVLSVSAEEPIILEEGTVSQEVSETVPGTVAENPVIPGDETAKDSTGIPEMDVLPAEDECLIDEILPVDSPEGDAKTETLSEESDFAYSDPVQADSSGDSYDTAIGIQFNRDYTGTITDQQTKIYYRLVLPSSGRMKLTASAKMEHISYAFYDQEGQYAGSTEAKWNSVTQLSSTVFSMDLVKGTYYFVVGQVRYYERTGNFSFQFSFESANESFEESQEVRYNSIDDAKEISIGTTYNGQLASNDTIDYYKVTLRSSGQLTLAAMAEIPDVTYAIYQEDGSALWDRDAKWNSTTKLSNITSSIDMVSGTYYLTVKQKRYYEATGNYSFTLSHADAGETFAESLDARRNDISTADPIQINEKCRGQIALNDTIDYYKFTLGTTTKMTVEASAEMSRISYKIYDNTGSQVWGKNAEWDTLTKRSTLEASVDLNAGMYYFVVGQVRYYETTGNYSFVLTTHAHKFEDHITPATLSADGKIVRKCSCGLVESTTPISHPETISLSAEEFTYTGQQKTPSVKIYGSDGKLISTSGYTVKYSSGRKKVGSYTVKITFKGNYQGTVQKKFIINPVKSGIAKLTARSNGFTVKVKTKKTEADGYQIQYSMDKSFQTSVRTRSLKGRTNVSMTCSGLGRKVKYYVRARTYREVSGVTYYSAWSSAKAVKTK